MIQIFQNKPQHFSFLEGIPNLGSDVLLLGFPNGNDSLSVEKGSILRFEKNRYTYSGLDYRNVLKSMRISNQEILGALPFKMAKWLVLYFKLVH